MKTNPDLFETIETPIVPPKDPNKPMTQRKVKGLFDYDERTDKHCQECVHNRRKYHRFYFCALFGFGTNKLKSCEKFRSLGGQNA